MDYKILPGDTATRHHFDMLIMAESKYMAALDKHARKFDSRGTPGLP